MTASAFVRDGRSAISPLTASKLAMPVRSRSPAPIEAAGQASTSLTGPVVARPLCPLFRAFRMQLPVVTFVHSDPDE
jgi:hypothetical protein